MNRQQLATGTVAHNVFVVVKNMKKRLKNNWLYGNINNTYILVTY